MKTPTEFLQRAIEIPSVSGNESEVAHYFVSEMQALGFSNTFVDDAGNARGTVGTGPKQIALLGHIDTVPGNIPVRLEGGILYGRGSVDAKGPFCTFVQACAAVSDGTKAAATFHLIGATEEETPTSKGARFVVDKLQPDFVFIGEPSHWDCITLGYKGRLIAKISLEKDQFHGAHFEPTAAEDLIQVFNNVKTWADQINDGASPFALLQYEIRDFKMNQQDTMQTAEMTMGFRLPPKWTPDVLSEKLKEFFADNLKVEFFGKEIPYVAEKDTPLTRAMRVAIRQNGGEPKFKYKTGTADMNVVAPNWNVPMVAYGAGDSQLDHTPNEHVEIAEYLKSIEVLKVALERLAVS